MLCLTVWNFLGTEIPYPSSQTETAMGIWVTAAAFIASQKMPSLVLASPMVTKHTSFPFLEKFVLFLSDSCCRYFLEAKANPNARAICPPVQETSLEILCVSR